MPHPPSVVAASATSTVSTSTTGRHWSPLVAKTGDTGSGLDVEGLMLQALAVRSDLPVPDVIHSEETLLIITLVEAGRMPGRMLARLEPLAARLGDWVGEPTAPSLLHGDAWGGNILCRDGQVAAFIDPAIYFGDPEIELAFGNLFDTFGAPFFRRYEALRPLASGFHEERRDLYNLYPLLVHVQLFGDGYVSSVDATLRRFGC